MSERRPSLENFDDVARAARAITTALSATGAICDQGKTESGDGYIDFEGGTLDSTDDVNELIESLDLPTTVRAQYDGQFTIIIKLIPTVLN
ncbi:MAG: hypothetical protein V4606_03435 [Patescibacteria group bacterium]